MRKQLCPGTKNRQIPTSIYEIIVIGSQAISGKTKSGNNLPCSNPKMLRYTMLFNLMEAMCPIKSVLGYTI